MTHEINIADFAAFCRSKGEEAYDFYDIRACALAQFGRHILGDGLREFEPVLVPAEEMQIPLVGATVPTWIYPATAALVFLAIVVWA